MKAQFQTPQEIRQQIWKELGRATKDRHHSWRKPVLATTTREGSVNARTVVLRQVNADAGRLAIYTDSRSSKVSELSCHPHAMLVFWSDRLSWQLRMKVTIQVETMGPDVDARWQSVSQSAAAADYLGLIAPGSLMSTESDSSASLSNVHHFAVLDAKVTEIDWLELSRSGHRRARIIADKWDWLTP